MTLSDDVLALDPVEKNHRLIRAMLYRAAQPGSQILTPHACQTILNEIDRLTAELARAREAEALAYARAAEVVAESAREDRIGADEERKHGHFFVGDLLLAGAAVQDATASVIRTLAPMTPAETLALARRIVADSDEAQGSVTRAMPHDGDMDNFRVNVAGMMTAIRGDMK